MSVNLAYTLTGKGWCQCTVTIGGASCTVVGSYLSDVLGNFVQAVTSLVAGAAEGRFSFDDEPGEYRWVINKISGSKVEIKIFQFEELCGRKPDTEGVEIFSGICDLSHFGMTLKKALDDLIGEYGLEGYKRAWHMHPFPFENYRLLCKNLGCKPEY